MSQDAKALQNGLLKEEAVHAPSTIPAHQATNGRVFDFLRTWKLWEFISIVWKFTLNISDENGRMFF